MEAPLYDEDAIVVEDEPTPVVAPPQAALRPREEEEEAGEADVALPEAPEVLEVTVEGELAGAAEAADAAAADVADKPAQDDDGADSDDDFVVITTISAPPVRASHGPTKHYLVGSNLNKWVRGGLQETEASSADGRNGSSSAGGVHSATLAALTPVTSSQAPQWDAKKEKYPPMAELQNPTGRSAFDVRMSELDDRPWMRNGADLSDFFNYGLTERTWLAYCERQLQIRYDNERRTKMLREERERRAAGRARVGFAALADESPSDSNGNTASGGPTRVHQPDMRSLGSASAARSATSPPQEKTSLQADGVGSASAGGREGREAREREGRSTGAGECGQERGGSRERAGRERGNYRYDDGPGRGRGYDDGWGQPGRRAMESYGQQQMPRNGMGGGGYGAMVDDDDSTSRGGGGGGYGDRRQDHEDHSSGSKRRRLGSRERDDRPAPRRGR